MPTKSRIFQPITDTDHVSIPRSIMRQIKALIMEGKLAPGDRLPGERQLMTELNVGRSTLREALQALEAVGLVKIVPGKGTFIQKVPSPPAPDLVPIWEWPSPPQNALADLFEVRTLLEVHAAGLAAERATPEAIDAVRAALGHLAMAIAKRDAEEMAIADMEFHRSLFLAAGNSYLVTLIDSIGAALHDARLSAFRLSGGLARTVPDHAAILEAVEARDRQRARETMAAHLAETYRLFILYLEKSDETAASPSGTNRVNSSDT